MVFFLYLIGGAKTEFKNIVLLFQDKGSLSGIFLLNMTLGFSSNEGINGDMTMYDQQNWFSELRRFCLSIVNQRKSTLSLSHSQEVFLTGIIFGYREYGVA